MNRKIISLITVIVASSTLITGCGGTQVKDAKATKTVMKTTNASEVSSYFSKDNGTLDKQLIKVINSSKSNLDIAIYSLTKEDIVDAIINAKKRGVMVRLITDRVESKSKPEFKQLERLKSAGIPIKINTHKGLMHMKVTIVDDKVATTGSYNYTQNATTENDEVLVIIHNSMDAQQFEKEFERMWNDTSNFK